MLCPKIFVSKVSLKKHILTHSSDRPFACKVCLKTFKRKYDVTAHMRVHRECPDFECDLCGKKLKSQNTYTIHRKRHMKEFSFKCEICGKGFVTNQEYLNHGSKHQVINNICYICGCSFYDLASLQRHMARHDDNYEQNRSIRCDICKKTFLQTKYLKEHFLRIHKDGGRRYMCHLCGKGIKSKTSLRDHMFVHQGLKPINCSKCEKSFALKTTLKSHMRTHTGERPYSCSVCHKSFNQRGPLKNIC